MQRAQEREWSKIDSTSSDKGHIGKLKVKKNLRRSFIRRKNVISYFQKFSDSVNFDDPASGTAVEAGYHMLLDINLSISPKKGCNFYGKFWKPFRICCENFGQTCWKINLYIYWGLAREPPSNLVNLSKITRKSIETKKCYRIFII